MAICIVRLVGWRGIGGRVLGGKSGGIRRFCIARMVLGGRRGGKRLLLEVEICAWEDFGLRTTCYVATTTQSEGYMIGI